MKRLLFLGLLVLALGVFGLGITMAQEGGDGDAGEPKPADELIARVAEKLGITEEQLRTAFQEAELELVDEAVAEGRLTEEQATRIRERISEGRIFFPFRPPHDKPYPRVHQLIVESAATVLGMEKEALVEELRSGQSPAEVAEAQGMNVEDFKSALLAEVQENLNAKVAEGDLTQEQADRIFEEIEEYIDRIVNGHFEPHDGPYPRVHQLIVESAATVLGMEKEALVEQLRDGQSLAEVAEAQGMSVDDFKAALLAEIKENLDAKVAEGDLTQEQADRIFAEIEEYIDRIVNGHFEPHHRAFGPAGGERFHPEEPPEE